MNDDDDNDDDDDDDVTLTLMTSYDVIGYVIMRVLFKPSSLSTSFCSSCVSFSASLTRFSACVHQPNIVGKVQGHYKVK